MDSVTTDSDVDQEDTLVWLKNNSEPWPEVVDNWRKTFSARQAQDKEKSILNILDTYPCFKKPLAYTLVNMLFLLFDTYISKNSI